MERALEPEPANVLPQSKRNVEADTWANHDWSYQGYGQTPASRAPIYGTGNAETRMEDTAAKVAAQKQARDLDQAEHVCSTTQDYANGLVGTLLPAYTRARDALDGSAVAEIGSRILAVLSILDTADETLTERLAALDQRSLAGADAAVDLEAFQRQDALRARAGVVQALVPTVVWQASLAMTPQRFKGEEVAGASVAIDVSKHAERKLAGELGRTLDMIETVRSIRALFAKDGALRIPR